MIRRWPRPWSAPPTAFTKLHHDIFVQLLPHGAELDPAVVDDLSNVTLTFINGLLLRFAHGDRIIETPEQLDGVLSAIVAGILHSEQQGRLTHDHTSLQPSPQPRRRQSSPNR